MKTLRTRPILPVLVGAVAMLFVLAGCAPEALVIQESAAVEASSGESMAASSHAEEPPHGFEQVVVSTDWLAENLENPNVRVIEVSVVPGVYERGHIPGAVNFVWHTDFVDTVRRDIVSPERFQELAQAAGINNDSTVVLYGDNNNWFAAWGSWIFTMYGADDVRILDGGRVKWEAEGRELAAVAPSPAPGNFEVDANLTHLRARMADVLNIVEGKTDAVILDIRGPAEYDGTLFAPEGSQELSVRAGHIPGAVNMPWSRAVNEDGTFKSVDELRQMYAEIGVDGSKPIVVYCRIGERASHTWFVLDRILGYDVRLYDGSWTEWGNTVGVPIENPSGTIWGAQ
jgi:thiosulfate/3-mercaptopyruvate sulfurtransferase